MAENYPVGKNRIFYKATAFRENLVVTVDVLDPQFNKYCGIQLVEVDGMGGLYYFDFTFEIGTYLMVFYECGQKTVSQVYNALGGGSCNFPAYKIGGSLINR